MKFTNDSLKAAVSAWLKDKSAAKAKYGDIAAWDTSGVDSMRELFADAKDFDEDLQLWNVSNVTDMHATFSGAASFNGNLSLWDVSRVRDMARMFQNATAFNGDLRRWDTSGVASMRFMFAGATAFAGDITAWDVASVQLFRHMLTGTTSLKGALYWRLHPDCHGHLELDAPHCELRPYGMDVEGPVVPSQARNEPAGATWKDPAGTTLGNRLAAAVSARIKNAVAWIEIQEAMGWASSWGSCEVCLHWEGSAASGEERRAYQASSVRSGGMNCCPNSAGSWRRRGKM